MLGRRTWSSRKSSGTKWSPSVGPPTGRSVRRGSKGRFKSFASRVIDVVRKRSDLKFFRAIPTGMNDSDIDSAGTYAIPCAEIDEGTGNDDRVGQRIFLEWLKLNISGEAGDADVKFRFMVLWSPTAQNALQFPGTDEIFDLNELPNVMVLLDFKFYFIADDADGQAGESENRGSRFYREIHVPLHRKTEYEYNATPGVNFTEQGYLYLWAVSDEGIGTGTPEFKCEWGLAYRDV